MSVFFIPYVFFCFVFYIKRVLAKGKKNKYKKKSRLLPDPVKKIGEIKNGGPVQFSMRGVLIYLFFM